MKLKNLTPFPFGTKITSRQAPRPELTPVLRACYVFEAGEPLCLPGRPSLVARGLLTSDTTRDEDAEWGGAGSDFAGAKLKRSTFGEA